MQHIIYVPGIYCSQVRGAPAIGIVAALSLAVELHKGKFENIEDLCSYVNTQMDYLITAKFQSICHSKNNPTKFKMATTKTHKT